MAWLFYLCAFLLAAAGDAATRPRLSPYRGERPAHYTNSWAVEVRGGLEAADALARKHGLKNLGQVGKLVDMYHFTMPDHRFQLLTRGLSEYEPLMLLTIAMKVEKHVGYVEQQVLHWYQKKGYSVPTDPQWPDQWSLLNTGQTTETQSDAGNDLNVEPAWIQGCTGKGSIVGVVDDGVGHNHTDLNLNYEFSLQYDFVGGDVDAFPEGEFGDCRDDHGTCCAGEIVMIKSNGVCGVGVAYETTITGIRLLGGEQVDLTEAKALSHNNDIIDIYSNSWGPFDDGILAEKMGTVLEMAVKQGVEQGRDGKGSIFVWAAGNGGQVNDSCAADGYASSIYTLAIGSASSDGNPAYYDEPCSGKIAVVFVNNPDTNDSDVQSVSSTTANGKCTSDFDGTSASTPLVSGVLTLALQANPDLTWRDVQYLLVYTSNPDLLVDDGDWSTNNAGLKFHLHFGFGAVDVEAVVTRARYWENVPTQRSDSVSPGDSGQLSPGDDLDVVINYNGDTTYAEHIVVTVNLYFEGFSENYEHYTDYDSLYFFAFYNFYGYHSPYDYNSTNYSNVTYEDFAVNGSRGGIQVELMSPSGTTSVLLPYRSIDLLPAGYSEWPFMSLHFWGEDPRGDWTLTVRYRGLNGTVTMDGLSVTIYGASTTPTSVADIPSQCNESCATTKGCAKAGSSEYCDRCGDGYLRDPETLECILEANCPDDFAVRSGYCYDPTAPDVNCYRGDGDKSGASATEAVNSLVVTTVCFLLALLN